MTAGSPPAPGPLTSIRVIDLAGALAGPYCAQLLADAGADVIKVEPPTGDETRHWGPPYLPACEPRPDYPGDSAYFACCNRNKRSIAVDLKLPAGQQVARRLASTADVLIENLKPGTMESWGLGYESHLRPLNHQLIFVSITGYGRDGLHASSPGYDLAIQAAAGLMSITGDAQGPPMKVGIAVSDLSTAVTAAFATAAALVGRATTGAGQRIDVSLFETQVSWLTNVAANYLVSGQAPSRYGNAHPNVVPYELFQTADREMVLAVGNDNQFLRFARALGHPEWAADGKFGLNTDRSNNRDDLIPRIRQILLGRQADEWIELFRSVGVPASLVRSVREVIDDLPVNHRRMILELDHPVAGPQRFLASPVRFDGAPGAVPHRPPMFSEHSQEILDELGYGSAEAKQLMQRRVVVAPTMAPSIEVKDKA